MNENIKLMADAVCVFGYLGVHRCVVWADPTCKSSTQVSKIKCVSTYGLDSKQLQPTELRKDAAEMHQIPATSTVNKPRFIDLNPRDQTAQTKKLVENRM